MSRDDLDAGIDELVAATDRLLLAVDSMTDEDLRGPSLLPGWTRGHVLSHLARNADAMVNQVTSAVTGEDVPMYAGGRAGRDADIEAGAGRHIGDIRLDLSDSAERLLEAFADFPDEALARQVRWPSGSTAYGWELPYLRLREVEIHHVDLDTGYSPADWSAAFAERTLDQLAPFFRDKRECAVGTLVATDADRRWEVAASGPELAGTRVELVAWLTGRSPGAGLSLTPPGDVPPAPPWS